MTNKKNYLFVVSTIFLVVGLVHLARITTGFEILIFNQPYPLWLSWIEMLIAFHLSFIGFKFARKN